MELCSHVLFIYSCFCVVEKSLQQQVGNDGFATGKVGQSGSWGTNIYGENPYAGLGLRFHQVSVAKISEAKAVNLNRTAQWLLLEQRNHPIALVMDQKSLSLSNLENHPRTLAFIDNLTTGEALTYKSGRESWAVVSAVSSEQSSHLQWYRIYNGTLETSWSTYLPGEITILQHFGPFLIAAAHDTLYLYRTDVSKPSDIWLAYSRKLRSAAVAVAMSPVGTSWRLFVAVPGQVDVYNLSIESGEVTVTKDLPLAIPDVSSLVSFKNGYNTYVATNGPDSAIWLLHDDSRYQRVAEEIGHVTIWKAVALATYRHDHVLLADNGTHIRVYSQESNGLFTSTSLMDLLPEEHEFRTQPDLAQELTLNGSSVNGQTVLLPFRRGDGGVLMVLGGRIIDVPDPLEEELDQLLLLKRKIMKEWDEQEGEAEELLSELAMLKGSEQAHTPIQSLTVRKMTTEEAVFAPVSNTDSMQVQSTEFANVVWTEEDSEEDLEALLQDLIALAGEIQDLEDQLENSMLPVEHMADNTVYQLPDFVNAGLTVDGTVFAEDVHITELNGRKLQKWMADTYRLDHQQKIGGTKTAKSASVRSLHFDTIGGTSKDDLVFVDELDNTVINGDVVFESDVMVVGDISLAPGGTVNGVNLAQHIVRVNAIPAGVVSLENVITDDLDVEKTINDITVILPPHSLSDFDINSIQQSRLERVIVNDVLTVSTINGVNITDVIHAFRDIGNTSRKIVTPTLKVENLNGLKFPEDFVRITEPAMIGGEKHFKRVVVQDFQTDWSTFLDLVDASDQNVEYEEERNGKQQTGDGAKVKERVNIDDYGINDVDYDFNVDIKNLDAFTIKVHGSIHSSGLVNGHDLRYINKHYLSKTKPQILPPQFIGSTLNITGNLNATLQHAHRDFPTKIDTIILTGALSAEFNEPTNIVFEDPVAIDHMQHINGRINGINLTELHEDVVYKDEINVDISGRKTFLGGITVNELNVETLNNKPLKDILTTNGSYLLNNSMTVNGSVTIVEDLLAYDLVNGVNITALGDRVSMTHGSILVRGDLELADGVVIENLVVGGYAGGKNIQKLLKNAAVLAESTKIKENVMFKQNVTINGNLTIIKSVNRINASFFDNIVLLDRPARLDRLILQKSAIFRRLTVDGDMRAPLLDNCDTATWEEEAVRLDKNTFIAGSVRLVDTDVRDSVVVDAINGHYFTNFFLLTMDQLLPGTVAIENITVSSAMQVDHFVNGVVLQEELEDTLMKYGNQDITGFKTFIEDVVIDGDLITDRVGDHILADIITTDTEQTISGNLTVDGKVFVFGNLNVGGHIEGVNLRDWYDRAMLPLPNQTIDGSWKVEGSVFVANDLTGSGMVTGQNLVNASEQYKSKEAEAARQYQTVCSNVSDLYEATKKELQLLDMLDDFQGIEFSHTILSLIPLKVLEQQYIIVTFSDLCSASIYRWDSQVGKLMFHMRADLGPVHVWTTLARPSSTILVTHNSGKTVCQDGRMSGNIWELEGSSLSHVTSMQPFQSIISSHVPHQFFTINANGTVSKWSLLDSLLHATHYYQLHSGYYRFVPAALGLDLAVWDGEVIIHIPNSPSGPIDSTPLPGASVAVTADGQLAALSDGQNTLLIIRQPPHGPLVDRLHFPKPTNVFWLDLHAPGQLYLVFASDHQKVHIFQYKGVSGMVEYLTLHHPSSSLASIQPIRELAHAVLVHGKAFRVLKPVMHGQPDLKLNFECNIP